MMKTTLVGIIKVRNFFLFLTLNDSKFMSKVDWEGEASSFPYCLCLARRAGPLVICMHVYRKGGLTLFLKLMFLIIINWVDCREVITLFIILCVFVSYVQCCVL